MSEAQQKLSYLKSAIEQQIDSVNKRRSINRNKAFRIYMAVASISAVTTVILGINVDSLKEYFRIAALILTAISTLINAYNAFFGHKDLWTSNNTAHNKLLELQFRIGFFEQGNDNITLEQVEEFKNSYQNIFNELNDSWLKNRSAQK